MSTDTSSTSRGAFSAVMKQLGKIRQSKSRQGIVLGLILIGIGMLLQEGVLAGMFGIYGATAVVISVVARVVLIRLRRKDD